MEFVAQWTIGEMIRRGEAAGLSLPLNKRVLEMIVEIEDGKRQQFWDNVVELHSLIEQLQA